MNPWKYYVMLFNSIVCCISGEVTEEDRLFSSLSDVVSDKTLQAIGEMGFTHMMEIQFRSIRPLLLGKLVRQFCKFMKLMIMKGLINNDGNVSVDKRLI